MKPIDYEDFDKLPAVVYQCQSCEVVFAAPDSAIHTCPICFDSDDPEHIQRVGTITVIDWRDSVGTPSEDEATALSKLALEYSVAREKAGLGRVIERGRAR